MTFVNTAMTGFMIGWKIGWDDRNDMATTFDGYYFDTCQTNRCGVGIWFKAGIVGAEVFNHWFENEPYYCTASIRVDEGAFSNQWLNTTT